MEETNELPTLAVALILNLNGRLAAAPRYHEYQKGYFLMLPSLVVHQVQVDVGTYETLYEHRHHAYVQAEGVTLPDQLDSAPLFRVTPEGVLERAT